MRERFQQTCCDPAFVNHFSEWSHSLKSLRCEAIEVFTKELLKLEFLLKRFWSKHKFLSGMNFSESDIRARVDAIDKALTSDSWWAAVALTHDLCFSCEVLGRWAEGCDCCEEVLVAGTGVKRRRTKWLSNSQQHLPCPYRGCRAVQMASGDWITKLESVMSEGQSRLSEYVVKGDHANIPLYLDEWVRARSKFWGQVRIKMAHFDQLPWKLCSSALAH